MKACILIYWKKCFIFILILRPRNTNYSSCLYTFFFWTALAILLSSQKKLKFPFFKNKSLHPISIVKGNNSYSLRENHGAVVACILPNMNKFCQKLRLFAHTWIWKRHNKATLLYLSQARTWICNVLCHGLF